MSLDSLAVKYLLDDDQPKLAALARATRILVGSKCPNDPSHPADDIDISRDGDGYCAACDEQYDLAQEAERILHDAGIYITLDVRT